MSPLVALINHSCDPNAVIVFPRANRDLLKHEPLMHVVALREINSDEEVRFLVLFDYVADHLPVNLADLDRLC